MSIKHSVLIITYNQQTLLPRALDSVLNQTPIPYEVIIGDDCSTDNTWEVVLQYQKMYPNIIRPYRNSNNLGVFGNVNKIITKPTGDIVSFLSGDDYFEQGIFKEYDRMISANNIDIFNGKFILIANSIAEFQNGKRVIKDNTRFEGKDLFKVKIRYGLDFRETGFSINVVKKLSPIPTDLGYNADWLFSIDQIVQSEDFYFTSKALPVYCVGIGVATKTKSELMKRSLVEVITRIEKLYSARLDTYDIMYLSFLKRLNRLELGEELPLFPMIKDYFIINKDDYLERDEVHSFRHRLIVVVLKKLHLDNFARSIYSIIVHDRN